MRNGAAGEGGHKRPGVHARRTAAIQNRDVRAAAGSGGMRASRPTAAPGGDGQPFWPQRLPWFVGEGHGPPGDIAAAQGPLQGLAMPQRCGSPVGRGPPPPFASLVKGRWLRRPARPEGLPRPQMPPPEAAANRKAIPRSPRSPPLTKGPFVRPRVFIHFPQNQNRAATPNQCCGLVLSTIFLQKRRKNCLIFSKCMVK